MNPLTAKAVSEIKQPISRFKDVAEMNACMLEWQKTLGLSEWLILPTFGDDLEDGRDAECEKRPVQKTAKITIRRPINPNWERMTTKNPDELFLVHELLHCKILYVDDDDSVQGKMYELYYHQAIHDLAKALVATKYGLPLSWFDNTKDDPELYPEKAEKE